MIIRSLTFGGAEQVMSLMGRYWVERGVKVSVITCNLPDDVDFYHLHPAIKRIQLPLSHPTLMSKIGFPWNIRALRKHIKNEGNPVVLSFMDRSNVPALLATRGLGVKVIVAERIDPTTQQYNFWRRFFMRRCYPLADAVTVLTENVKKKWADCFISPHKVHVIHNPVRYQDIGEETPDWLPEKFICCMGRLHKQKGFDLLFDILPQVFEKYPKHHLVILGEGIHRSQLEEQAARLGLSRQILMPGFLSNPHAIMRKADLFVFPSRWEGFPNALLEAMSLGLPVISFDCPSGPGVIIDNEITGILAPPEDSSALQTQILRLLDEPRLRAALGRQASWHINQACKLETIMNAWEQLIDRVMLGEIAPPILTQVKVGVPDEAAP